MSAGFLLDESAPTSVLKVLKKRGFEAVRLIDIGLVGLKNSEVEINGKKYQVKTRGFRKVMKELKKLCAREFTTSE